ncbi:hypothetical protein D3C78_1745080 [compost metagenome]
MGEWAAAERECLYMEAKDYGFSIAASHSTLDSLSDAIRAHLSATALGAKLGHGHVGDISDRAAARVLEVRHG